ncbi:adhesion G protein-coupled receptor F4 [Ctenopharyngodon idella]|uniref:adhesion G protein-coupled receptor F4 n=1 Tax=Ctenopharyngodon idella TaxID=7959 RepID=UPI00222F5D1B|nr:adhesion G protein-coupled receptor F4 [Ctenopharyngodon idella]
MQVFFILFTTISNNTINTITINTINNNTINTITINAIPINNNTINTITINTTTINNNTINTINNNTINTITINNNTITINTTTISNNTINNNTINNNIINTTTNNNINTITINTITINNNTINNNTINTITINTTTINTITINTITINNNIINTITINNTTINNTINNNTINTITINNTTINTTINNNTINNNTINTITINTTTINTITINNNIINTITINHTTINTITINTINNIIDTITINTTTINNNTITINTTTINNNNTNTTTTNNNTITINNNTINTTAINNNTITINKNNENNSISNNTINNNTINNIINTINTTNTIINTTTIINIINTIAINTIAINKNTINTTNTTNTNTNTINTNTINNENNRPGSVIADYTINATSSNLNFTAANTAVTESLKTEGVVLSENAFAQSDFDCRDEEIGLGNTNEEKTGICRSGFKGTIIYNCSIPVWTPVQDNCVLEVIFNLKNRVETLLVVEIPQFMAELSSATAQNNVNITQSPATVRTIVDILFKIADLSQATLINSIVMENYLKTVNIIVSVNASGTWNKLNNGNTTENTSIRLLDAIEKISDRLKDEFAINETSIQLNRITIENSFSITSTLPNSTTEIVIPQVPNVTIVTIIIFTTLDNVLPTRDTSGKNYTNNSFVRINGDVVVVKVDQTINNISFTFDITNQSLGNPQCVFWNFNLDGWDSTGCEVKPSANQTSKITCECNHTTSFSILMSPFSLGHTALAYITYIGVAISMASLILCLIIETIVWKSVSGNDTSYVRHVSMVNIAVSLLIANICFIIGAAITEKEQPTSVVRCSPAVFFMHFFYLALFFWMLISALFLFYRTVMVLSQMSRFKMMAIAFIVGYGAPLLIAAITVASTAGSQKYISKSACWLNWFESKALLAFVIPALTIVAINLVILIVVLYTMLRRGIGAATLPDEKHALVVIARCVAILTPIFGLTWGFGIGTMVSPDFGVHVVFALLNSLQGFFILVFGTLLDSKIREALAGRLSLRNLTSSIHTRSTSTGPSSSSRLGLFRRKRRRNVYNVSEASSFSAATS